MKTTDSQENNTSLQSSQSFFDKKREGILLSLTNELNQPFFSPTLGTQKDSTNPSSSLVEKNNPRPGSIIYPKLTINEPGDKYEQEADAIADQVMHMKEPVSTTGDEGLVQAKPLNNVAIQPKCAACEEEKTQHPSMEEELGQSGPLMRKSIAGGGYAASPQLASQLSSTKGGGVPLPDKTLASMNHAFNSDFSTVRIHTGDHAAEMSQAIRAKAFTHGSDIYFNKGKFAPETREGKHLLAHELTHVGQQQVNPGLIQRGEAPVHEDIEKTATAGIDERLQDEMYVGNWMRDHSQFNTATAHGIISKIPKKLSVPGGDKIGAKGAEDIIIAVIRSLAFLHFGPDLTNQAVTRENIGVYTPEQHVDNPMGTSAADHLVRDSQSGLLRPGLPQNEVQNQGSGFATTYNEDRDRDMQLAGKAFPGLQAENPELFRVSDAGLTNHIYNATEWVKEQLGMAMVAGESATGRMYLGTALHAVEDYFAHSNFIEVALNSVIGKAIKDRRTLGKSALSSSFLDESMTNKADTGAFVDTLYDAATLDGRMAVTTGTAGRDDLKVSIGQILLPKLPDLSEKVNQKIDEMLNLVIAEEGNSTWEKIQEKLKMDNGGWAVLELLGALDKHISVPVFDIYLTRINIPFTSKFVPTGYKTNTYDLGIVSAIKHYIDLYKSIIGRIDEAETWVHIVMPITLLLDLKSKILDLINTYIEKLRQEIKTRINQLLLSLAEDLTGIDLKDAKKRGVDYALKYAAEAGVEHIRSKTSIASQMPEILNKYKDDPETLWNVYGISGGNLMFALPPSHSEISKDHAPHEDKSALNPSTPKATSDNYDIEQGSPFYRLHRELAIEADSHIILKIQNIWSSQMQISTSDNLYATPQINENTIMQESLRHQATEEKRAIKDGRNLDIGNRGKSNQELFALADYFIAHPDDTSWWKPILTNYVNNNEEEVIKHIKERNKTRRKR